MRNNLYENLFVQRLNVEDALTATNYPVSGSYIDVRPFTHFAFLIEAGALDSALTPQVIQDTSATETASVKDITDATVTIAADDDDQTFCIEVETARLDIDDDFRYVSLTMTGAAGGNDYGAVTFLGWNVREVPVTQHSSFPSTNTTRVVG